MRPLLSQCSQAARSRAGHQPGLHRTPWGSSRTGVADVCALGKLSLRLHSLPGLSATPPRLRPLLGREKGRRAWEVPPRPVLSCCLPQPCSASRSPGPRSLPSPLSDLAPPRWALGRLPTPLCPSCLLCVPSAPVPASLAPVQCHQPWILNTFSVQPPPASSPLLQTAWVLPTCAPPAGA